MATSDSKNMKVLSTVRYEGKSGGYTIYPTGRDGMLQGSHMWLRNKRIDDDVGDFWRIHDGIYDLTDFISQHPGGKVWLEKTRGTDITEAFESAHFSGTPEHTLKKYKVRKATKPRLSPYTFKEDGFYKTLKRRGTCSGDASCSINLKCLKNSISCLLSLFIIFLRSFIHVSYWPILAFDVLFSFAMSLTVASFNLFYWRRAACVVLGSLDSYQLKHFVFGLKVAPIIKEVGQGPTLRMKLYIDGGLFMFLTLLCLSAKWHSYSLAVLAGITLALIVVMAHNFFHQKDNWRMYVFDLGLVSSDDWRVSHALSHHLYPNTIFDHEIAIFEPFFSFLPYEEKSWFQIYGPYLYSHIIYCVGLFFYNICKLYYILSGQQPLLYENFLPLTELMVCMILSSSYSAGFCYVFLFIGITSAHHHPEIFHEGDKMRTDSDFGLCQLDAVREKKETVGSLFLASTTFGHHTLHHLFPTVDHSKLHYLYAPFTKTCEEFGISFPFFNYVDLLLGCYKQMGRVQTNPNLMLKGVKKKRN